MIDISFKNRTGVKPVLLSAIIGADSFFYGLFDHDNTLLESQFFNRINFRSEDDLSRVKDALFGTEGLEIKIASSSKPFLHSPIESTGKTLKFFPAFKNKVVDLDKLTDQEVVVEYGISQDQKLFLERIFGNFSLFHISTALSNMYYPYSTGMMHALFDDGKVHLLYAKDREFIYYNQFVCKDENDYLYFILLAYETMGVNPDSDPLSVSGRIERDSTLHELLLGYIRHVEWAKSELLKVSDLRFRGKQHYYQDLFSTALCV